MKMALVCEKMAWDFHTYQDQPDAFIDLLYRKFVADAQHAEREMKKQQSKYGRGRKTPSGD